MTARLVALVGGVVVLLAPGPAAAGGRCPGGRFLIEPAALQTNGGAAVESVVIDGGAVSIGACGPARMRARRGHGGMTLRARWAACPALGGAVRLKARIDRACGRMTGIVRAHGADVRWRFHATRIPVCGNGVREGDEECDAPGACCSTACRLTDAPDCVATLCSTDGDCTGGTYCAGDGCGGVGVCRARPEACVGVLEPVCGCDGRSYVNACEAARAGIGVLDRGHCPRTCGTIVGIECPADSFCEFPPGTCGIADLGGTCLPQPDVCPEVYRPVCACDGHTYGDDCARQAAGVARAHGGSCVCPPVVCPDGLRCPDTCRAPCRQPCDCYRTPGLEFPAPCPLACASCDNYWVCEDGLCAGRCGPVPPGQDQCIAPAGCTSSADCAAADFCAREPGACNGSGTCRPRPDVCPQIYAPVCGCDGHTYGNACEAEAAGTTAAARGPCPRVCGTIAGLGCPRGQFCDLESGQCDVADGGGVCAEIPSLCPELYHPVCGCDGTTYGNDCERRAKQAQKAHDGSCVCKPITCGPGTAPVDTDRDGCADACGPSCRSTCDCYAHPFAGPACLAACPTCGSFWSCEDGACVERCGPIPLDRLPGVCPG